MLGALIAKQYAKHETKARMVEVHVILQSSLSVQHDTEYLILCGEDLQKFKIAWSMACSLLEVD